MSVELDWSKLDEELANKVRDFLNKRFQSSSLPAILKSIEVVSFEFGSIPPTIEIVDITDPYSAFYEESYDGDDADEEHPESEPPEYSSQAQYEQDTQTEGSTREDRPPRPMSYVDAWAPPFVGGRPGQVFPPFFHATAGIIPSGIATPNWMQSAGISRRPISISPSPSAIDAENVHSPASAPGQNTSGTSTTGSFRPRSDTIDTTLSSRPAASPRLLHIDTFSRPTTSQSTTRELLPRSDTDIQIIAKINYEGNPRAQIHAELDFNYPSSSFISLPIRLTLTGLSFSGLALIASIRNRIHFCLLDVDEADDDKWEHMLKDIRLESEIGERGKGVLKNVGKVERFLLEQGRKIITEEFVFPSFYTFIL